MVEEAGRFDATELHRVGRHLAASSTPSAKNGRRSGRSTGRTALPISADSSRSPTTDAAASGSREGEPSRTAPSCGPRCCRSRRRSPTLDPGTCQELPDPRDHGARMWDALVGARPARARHRAASRQPRDPTPPLGDRRPRHAARRDRRGRRDRRRTRPGRFRRTPPGVRLRPGPGAPRRRRVRPRRRARPTGWSLRRSGRPSSPATITARSPAVADRR